MDHTEFKQPKYNLLNGQFLKGHQTFNKGKPWSEWMSKRAQRKVLKNLDRVRPKGGNPNIPGANRRKVVCINAEGEWALYSSSTAAGENLGICRRNITACCRGKRKHCGG